MKDERYRAPLVQVSSLERNELRSGVEDLALSNNDLMQRVLVHEFIIVTRLGVSIHCHLALAVIDILRRGRHLMHRAVRQGNYSPLGHPIRALRRRQRKNGPVLLFFDLLQSSLSLGVRSCPLNWHKNASLYRLQIETDGACSFTTCGDLSFDKLLALVIELDTFAGDRRSTFLKGWRQIDIFRHTASDN